MDIEKARGQRVNSDATEFINLIQKPSPELTDYIASFDMLKTKLTATKS